MKKCPELLWQVVEEEIKRLRGEQLRYESCVFRWQILGQSSKVKGH